MRLGDRLGPSLAGVRRRARRGQRAGGRLRALRRPPRRPRSRRGRGAAPPLRADGLARPRRRVAAPACLQGPGARAWRPTCAAGVHAPGEAAVDPRLLLPALAAAVERCGRPGAGRGRGHGRAHRGRSPGRGDHRGRARAPRRARGSGHRRLVGSRRLGCRPRRDRPVRPVKGQILTLRGNPDQPVCERIVASERVYLVPRPDGRLIVGATVEERGFDVQVTAGGVHELLREAYRALPEVAELELVETLAGLRPGTPDNAPLDRSRGAGRPRARHGSLPQRHPADADLRRGDRRAAGPEPPPPEAAGRPPGPLRGREPPPAWWPRRRTEEAPR